jgi:hypothetical protein
MAAIEASSCSERLARSMIQPNPVAGEYLLPLGRPDD